MKNPIRLREGVSRHIREVFIVQLNEGFGFKFAFLDQTFKVELFKHYLNRVGRKLPEIYCGKKVTVVLDVTSINKLFLISIKKSKSNAVW